MNLLVPLKMVPDLVEELTLNEAGTDLDRDVLTYKLNEFDDQALEEALQLKALHGGTVIVAGLDTPEIDQVFYTAIAKGADRAVKITGDFDPLVDSWTAAAAIAPVVASLEVDLVLAGVQAPDDLFGQLPVLLAGRLGWPHVSVVSGIELDPQARVARCHQEYSGGVMAAMETALPAVLGVQAARQTPRYAAISRIRQVMKEAKLEEVPAPPATNGGRPTVRRLFKPESQGHARMLEGDVPGQIEQLVGLLAERGLLKVRV